MSLQHILTPDVDADFKSLKVNGTPIVSSPALVTYTPVLTGTSLTNFLDVSASHSKNGKFLTMNCQFKANVIGQPLFVQVNVPLPAGETVKVGTPYQWGIGNAGPNVSGDSIWCSSTKSSLPTSCSMFLSADKLPNNGGLFFWSVQFIIEVQ